MQKTLYSDILGALHCKGCRVWFLAGPVSFSFVTIRGPLPTSVQRVCPPAGAPMCLEGWASLDQTEEKAAQHTPFHTWQGMKHEQGFCIYGRVRQRPGMCGRRIQSLSWKNYYSSRREERSQVIPAIPATWQVNAGGL